MTILLVSLMRSITTLSDNKVELANRETGGDF